MQDLTIFTIGHSNRSIDEFVRLLRAWSVRFVADVRTVPRSRRNPHFDRDTLPDALRAVDIGYEWLRGLGGWRRPAADSPNRGWRIASFRGYADYMSTPEFDAAVARLIEDAKAHRTVAMCAEAVPWRCHRNLIADALTVRGVEVHHITSKTRAAHHALTPFAFVEGTRITYPES